MLKKSNTEVLDLCFKSDKYSCLLVERLLTPMLTAIFAVKIPIFMERTIHMGGINVMRSTFRAGEGRSRTN